MMKLQAYMDAVLGILASCDEFSAMSILCVAIDNCAARFNVPSEELFDQLRQTIKEVNGELGAVEAPYSPKVRITVKGVVINDG